ncbi:peptidase M48 [Spirochaetia bacterium]|nr:peptidase M48 [Spirochaetia bacterium]
MKKTINRIIPICILSGFAVLFLSCAGIAKAIGDSADDLGDSRAAGVLSRSAHSIGRALEDITPEQEYFIGRAVGANLLTNYQFCNERPELTLYLNQITAAIVANSPKPELYNGYHTAILDSDEINAFATSGGHIFIAVGLLNCASSEDTLAAVIAHEIAHIQLQHSLKAIKSNRVVSAIIETSTSVAGLVLSELTDVLDEAAKDIVTAMQEGYSQEQEFDADKLALELLANAGYEPSSLLIMLRALKQNQLTGNARRHPGGFSNTHPSPDERIAKLERPLRQYERKAPDSVQDTQTYRKARFEAATAKYGVPH